jgi:hypothetical protein
MVKGMVGPGFGGLRVQDTVFERVVVSAGMPLVEVGRGLGWGWLGFFRGWEICLGDVGVQGLGEVKGD